MNDLETNYFFWSAVEQGDLVTARMLCKNRNDANVRKWNTDETPLYVAIKHARVELISVLYHLGADINANSGRKGYTPLHEAIAGRQVEMVNLLLHLGADVLIRGGKYNATPLHFATKFCPSVIVILCEAGADVNAQDIHGYRPLHWAVWDGTADTVLTLRRLGADVNAVCDDGQTALHRAAMKFRADILPLLLSFGADINAEDNKAWTPLLTMLDAERGGPKHQQAVLSILHGRGVHVDVYLRSWSTTGREHIIIRALNTCLSCNRQQIHSGFIHIVHRLLQSGAGIGRSKDVGGFLGKTSKRPDQFSLHMLLLVLEAGLITKYKQLGECLKCHENCSNMSNTLVSGLDTKENVNRLFQDCMTYLTEPRSLEVLCRNVLRHRLFIVSGKSEIISAIQEFNNIPQKVKHFLCLQNLPLHPYGY